MGSHARPVASALCRLDSKASECAQSSELRPPDHAHVCVQPCVTLRARASRSSTKPLPEAVRQCTMQNIRFLTMEFTPDIIALFLRHDPHPIPIHTTRNPPSHWLLRSTAQQLAPAAHHTISSFKSKGTIFSRSLAAPSPQRAAPADRKRLLASRTGSDGKAALSSIDQGAQWWRNAKHDELATSHSDARSAE